MPACSIHTCQNKYYAKGFCSLHYQRTRLKGHPLKITLLRAPPLVRFWNFVKSKKSGECWIFTGGGSGSRYGQFQVSKKNRDHTLAHRYSYELHKGQIPAGMIVMHSCDNPRCVNPDHLSVGTFQDNTDDMMTKNRHARMAPLGTDNGKALLSPSKVRIIRKSGLTNVALAARFGVSVNCIRGVRIGRTWNHVK